jgi:hypothetical protein
MVFNTRASGGPLAGADAQHTVRRWTLLWVPVFIGTFPGGE